MEETKHQEIGRLHTKLGWRDGHFGSHENLPVVTVYSRKTGLVDVLAPSWEVSAYSEGFVEGRAAKAAGIPGNANPYNLGNIRSNGATR